MAAIAMLDDMEKYPYLKIRVCLDGSIKAFLGTEDVDWDLERQIYETAADPDTAWVENPYINTEQFKHIEMWQHFDSINALAYYLITKYENNIFSIGPKDIKPGIPKTLHPVQTYYKVGAGSFNIVLKEGSVVSTLVTDAEDNQTSYQVVLPINLVAPVTISTAINKIQANSFKEALFYAFLKEYGAITIGTNGEITYNTVSTPDLVVTAGNVTYTIGVLSIQEREIQISSSDLSKLVTKTSETKDVDVADVVGLDYELTESDLSTNSSGDCVPCCKKQNLSRAIWAYVNPKTMSPYDDDYWFHQGEPYIKKSLTIGTKESKLNAKKIVVTAGDFPGMYKIVGETYIRSRETGEDERVQICFPLCKIRSDQTLTLEAEGDPTTFNLDVEVAVPPSGIPMEITFYDVEKEMKLGCNGSMIEKDGSTRVTAK